MTIWEIIGGVMLIISGLLLIVIVLLQEGKQNGLSGAIQGGSSESYLNHNEGRTREAKLKKFTKILAIVFFLLTIAANLAAIFLS